ncbi:hypothetical protein ACFLZX_01245 [Nanoarchaeota archaeon]
MTSEPSQSQQGAFYATMVKVEHPANVRPYQSYHILDISQKLPSDFHQERLEHIQGDPKGTAVIAGQKELDDFTNLRDYARYLWGTYGGLPTLISDSECTIEFHEGVPGDPEKLILEERLEEPSTGFIFLD